MYTEDQLLPLSALQHLLFCERQCALIHIEQVWQDNRLTAEGRLLHENVHDGPDESRGDLRIVRGLRLRSLELGVVGMADVVEFVRVPDGKGIALPGARGHWIPHPVEYKRGRPKPDDCDKVQLCAQALCLEEMLSAAVPGGAIFYGQPRRRLPVGFDLSLRGVTRQTAERLHALIAAGVTPPPAFETKCGRCSLNELCLPSSAGPKRKVQAYLNEVL
jgi:CRISPR-associated exonuclease Cas4